MYNGISHFAYDLAQTISLIAFTIVAPMETKKNNLFDPALILQVVSRKWWVVPVTMLIGLTFMFWQESDLQTAPTYFTKTQAFEPLDEAGPLSIVGLDPALIRPFPSEANQLVNLLSATTKAELLAKIDGPVDINVVRSEPNFSLTSYYGTEGRNRFSFVSFGSSSYTFTCTETEPLNCQKAIDAYAAKLVSIRTQATKAGLQNSIQLIDSLISSPKNISAASLDQLRLQRQALDKSIELITGELKLVFDQEYFGGEQVTTVKKSTYIFGLLIGLIIGCLILLQLIFSDGKIRSAKQLVNLVGYKQFLGTVTAKSQASSLQHLAAAIKGVHYIKKSTSLRIISVGSIGEGKQTVKDLKKILSCEVTFAGQIQSLDAKALAVATDSPVILLTNKHQSATAELQYTWTVVEKSGNTILGVVLVG